VPIKLLGDTAYRILDLGLHGVAQHVRLIAPFRLDSVIHQPAQARTKHTITASACGGQTSALARISLAYPQDGVAAPHGGLGRRRQTRRGDLYGHGAVLALWLCSFAHPLGAHARS